MNRCPDKTQWVLYAAGEVSDRLRRRLRAHLAACADCRREQEAVARGLSALGALDPEPAVRPEVLETLRRRLAVAAAHRAVRPTLLVTVYRYRWVAAAAVLIAAAVAYALLPTTETPASRWIDEDQFVAEMAEITAGVEILESSAYAGVMENGNGEKADQADTIEGQSRRPLKDFPNLIGATG
jgi:anti-sigma-K factor RskA